ncbi:MAG: Tad domain-containing protein [Acidimicrobiales bacterium]|nr:Tad domain-containing protein [Acidimicrobiales bacterium]
MNRSTRTPREFARDAGYAVVMTALILVPLLGFAGFAVDVGAWYSRAASLQRAADAAALAGVVWQPDFSTAETEARAAAARNGFTHGVDNIEVLVTNAGTHQLKVEIIDTDAEMFFASLFLDNVTIGRHAIAEYAEPVPLGSPANVMGFGTESIGGEAPSYAWTAMMGHCTHSAYGDLLSLIADDDFSNNNNDCGTRGTNPYHEDAGYEWIIEIPTASNVDINIWDVGNCKNSDRPVNAAQNDDYDTAIQFRLFAPDNTPLTFADNPQYGSTVIGADQVGCGVWTTLWTTNGTPGQWVLRTAILDSDDEQLFDDEGGPDEGGQNYFSIWADSPVTTNYCLTFADANCPGVYANQWMPVRTQPPTDGSAPAEFYLAEIEPQHQSKTLIISLWDPGEGMESMEVLDPNGDPVDFTYSTAYSVKGTPVGVSTPSLCGNGVDPYCLWVTGAVWDGQLVRIEVPLAGLDWGSYPNDWFKVRYTLITGQTSADWTTWGVEVVGDPVRLLE